MTCRCLTGSGPRQGDNVCSFLFQWAAKLSFAAVVVCLCCFCCYCCLFGCICSFVCLFQILPSTFLVLMLLTIHLLIHNFPGTRNLYHHEHFYKKSFSHTVFRVDNWTSAHTSALEWPVPQSRPVLWCKTRGGHVTTKDFCVKMSLTFKVLSAYPSPVVERWYWLLWIIIDVI